MNAVLYGLFKYPDRDEFIVADDASNVRGYPPDMVEFQKISEAYAFASKKDILSDTVVWST